MSSPAVSLRRDALPEGHEYRDTGCRFHDACLTCPFARCKLDEPQVRVDPGLLEHQQVQIETMLRQKRTVRQIASVLGVSRRTVFRRLAAARG